MLLGKGAPISTPKDKVGAMVIGKVNLGGQVAACALIPILHWWFSQATNKH